MCSTTYLSPFRAAQLQQCNTIIINTVILLRIGIVHYHIFHFALDSIFYFTILFTLSEYNFGVVFYRRIHRVRGIYESRKLASGDMTVIYSHVVQHILHRL